MTQHGVLSDDVRATTALCDRRRLPLYTATLHKVLLAWACELAHAGNKALRRIPSNVVRERIAAFLPGWADGRYAYGVIVITEYKLENFREFLMRPEVLPFHERVVPWFVVPRNVD